MHYPYALNHIDHASVIFFIFLPVYRFDLRHNTFRNALSLIIVEFENLYLLVDVIHAIIYTMIISFL